MGSRSQQRGSVFVSYSHLDADWLERVRVHLKPLEREYDIEIWDDTKIQAGTEWREEIRKAVQSAKVAVLIISANFLASDFITKNELPPLLDAADREGAVILSLVVSPSRFMSEKALFKFQAVNAPSNPLIGLGKSEQENILLKLTYDIENALLTAAPGTLDETLEDRINELGDLVSHGDSNAEQELIQLLSKPDPDIRFAVARKLGELKCVSALDQLILSLNDEDPDVTAVVASALGEIGLSAAIDPLIQKLDHSDRFVRANAARSLGKLGEVSAVQRLIHMMRNDSISDVRDAATEALADLEDMNVFQAKRALARARQLGVVQLPQQPGG